MQELSHLRAVSLDSFLIYRLWLVCNSHLQFLALTLFRSTKHCPQYAIELVEDRPTGYFASATYELVWLGTTEKELLLHLAASWVGLEPNTSGVKLNCATCHKKLNESLDTNDCWPCDATREIMDPEIISKVVSKSGKHSGGESVETKHGFFLSVFKSKTEWKSLTMIYTHTQHQLIFFAIPPVHLTCRLE